MPNDGKHFATSHPIWGWNMFNQLPDVMERNFETDVEGASFAITKSDSTALAVPISKLYVGGTGDIAVKTTAGTTLLLKAVPAGKLDLEFTILYVLATNTTATNLIGIY